MTHELPTEAALPEDVSASLLRGLGAYLRATPTQDLPTNLRRFKGLRDKALMQQRAVVLGLLESETDRALVLQWLDNDKPPLNKSDLKTLRIAVERAEGWEEELASTSSGPKKPVDQDGAGERHERELEREREKARKARDELRRAREAHDAEIRSERAQVATLKTELASVKAELDAARARTGELEAQLASETERADREVRRARSAAEKESARTDELNAELKRLRRDLEKTQDSLRELRSTRAAAKKKRSPPPERVPEGPREPLPVPKGRYETDPETLSEWLDHPNVLLVVDGYNVTKAEGGYGDLSLEKQRERLIDEAMKLGRRKNVKGHIVFDGAEIEGGGHRRPRGPLKVEYSKPGEIADDHIVALIETLPPVPVILVTNDTELQGRAAALGATIATSQQLLSLLR